MEFKNRYKYSEEIDEEFSQKITDTERMIKENQKKLKETFELLEIELIKNTKI